MRNKRAELLELIDSIGVQDPLIVAFVEETYSSIEQRRDGFLYRESPELGTPSEVHWSADEYMQRAENEKEEERVQYLIQKAITLFSEDGDTTAELMAWQKLSQSHQRSASFDIALSILEDVQQKARKVDFFAIEVKTRVYIGILYWESGRYDKALISFEDAMYRQEHLEEGQLIGVLWDYRGRVYVQLKQYNLAEKCFKKAEELYCTHNEEKNYAIVLALHARLSLYIGNMDFAVELLRKCPVTIQRQEKRRTPGEKT